MSRPRELLEESKRRKSREDRRESEVLPRLRLVKLERDEQRLPVGMLAFDFVRGVVAPPPTDVKGCCKTVSGRGSWANPTTSCCL